MASDPLDMAVLPVQVVVTSESDPGTTYLVQLPYCPCKDFRYRRAGLLARLAAGGAGITLDEMFCKHLRKGLALVGGWHEAPTAAPEQVTHYRLTRDNAGTLLTSACLASDLVNRLLKAAWEAPGSDVTEHITNGAVMVKYSSTEHRYTVTLPSGQAIFLPEGWRDAERVAHRDVSRERARTLLAEAGIDDEKARRVLASIRVPGGLDTLRLRGGGEALVSYRDKVGRYTVTLPA
jgi:hypothetical protein